MDQRVSSYESFTLSNPNADDLEWFIDAEVLKNSSIFNISPFEGVLKGYESVEIKAAFNPYNHGDFQQTTDLYLDGDRTKSHI